MRMEMICYIALLVKFVDYSLEEGRVGGFVIVFEIDMGKKDVDFTGIVNPATTMCERIQVRLLTSLRLGKSGSLHPVDQ